MYKYSHKCCCFCTEFVNASNILSRSLDMLAEVYYHHTCNNYPEMLNIPTIGFGGFI